MPNRCLIEKSSFSAMMLSPNHCDILDSGRDERFMPALPSYRRNPASHGVEKMDYPTTIMVRRSMIKKSELDDREGHWVEHRLLASIKDTAPRNNAAARCATSTVAYKPQAFCTFGAPSNTPIVRQKPAILCCRALCHHQWGNNGDARCRQLAPIFPSFLLPPESSRKESTTSRVGFKSQKEKSPRKPACGKESAFNSSCVTSSTMNASTSQALHRVDRRQGTRSESRSSSSTTANEGQKKNLEKIKIPQLNLHSGNVKEQLAKFESHRTALMEKRAVEHREVVKST